MTMLFLTGNPPRCMQSCACCVYIDINEILILPAKCYLIPDETNLEEDLNLSLKTDTNINKDGSTRIISGLKIYPRGAGNGHHTHVPVDSNWKYSI